MLPVCQMKKALWLKPKPMILRKLLNTHNSFLKHLKSQIDCYLVFFCQNMCYVNGLAARSAMETGRFLTAALLKEDFRYRPSSSKNPFGRAAHAIAFTFVDKSDSGHNRLAISNFVAAGAGGFVGNLYLPRGFNDVSHAQTRMAIELGGLAGQNLLREFAPELLKLARKLHAPFPRVPLPEWWVKLDR